MTDHRIPRRTALGLAAAVPVLAAARPAQARPRWQPEPIRGFMSNGSISRPNDFATMKEWGATGVRLQMPAYRWAKELGLTFWEAWPTIVSWVTSEVQRAQEAGIKIVVDLHDPALPGVVRDQPTFWSHPDLVPNLKRAWGDLAASLLPYRDAVWGFDLMNEPLDRTQLPAMPQQWPEIAEEVTAHIRTIDRRTPIVFETGPGWYFTGFSSLSAPLSDPRVIYSGHFYASDKFTHQGVFDDTIGIRYPGTADGQYWDRSRLAEEMAPAVEFSRKWSVPIYVGELSVIRWAPKEDAVQWLTDVLELIEEQQWSWAYHAFGEWHGWSLLYGEEFWKEGMEPRPKPVDYETERAKVIKSFLRTHRAPR